MATAALVEAFSLSQRVLARLAHVLDLDPETIEERVHVGLDMHDRPVVTMPLSTLARLLTKTG